MAICKHFVLGKCNKENCKFEHIDNICRNNFFGKCERPNCKFNHNYKLEQNNKIKNTESFIPVHDPPSLRIKFNEPISNGNEVAIINNIFEDKTLYKKLISEINNEVYKPWHGDSHLIADDSHLINWKDESETFQLIINKLCNYFCMTPGATRFNYYINTMNWKPYHHDAAALKPEKAKYQNITVGLSLGYTREISFQSTQKNKSERTTINFPLKDGTVYAFGNKVNTDFRHGIPQINEHIFEGRISIIIWGYSNLIE